MEKITLQQANNALMFICGTKHDGLLDDVKMSNRTARRTMILDDYQWNSHSIKGINSLNTVLLYLLQLEDNDAAY